MLTYADIPPKLTNINIMKEKLLPCPFCGSEALVSHLSNIYDDAYVVKCSGENDSSCIALSVEGFDDYESDAIIAWNKRSN